MPSGSEYAFGPGVSAFCGGALRNDMEAARTGTLRYSDAYLGPGVSSILGGAVRAPMVKAGGTDLTRRSPLSTAYWPGPAVAGEVSGRGKGQGEEIQSLFVLFIFYAKERERHTHTHKDKRQR